MGEGDGDVGEDDGGVGEDLGDDDGPRRRSGATGSKGERAPLLIILPWPSPSMGEGFPLWSLAPMAWEGESPSEIGSISLFLHSLILPLHRFLYMWRSITPIGVNLSPRSFS